MGDVIEFKKKPADIEETVTAIQLICPDCLTEEFHWYVQIPYIFMHCQGCGSGYRAGVPMNVLSVMTMDNVRMDDDEGD